MPAVKEKLSAVLSFPKEITLDLPIVQAIGRNEVSIENYKSLLEFSDEVIRVRTKDGIMAVEGSGLILRHVTVESILISGKILGIIYS